jgi:hypothetical protein
MDADRMAMEHATTVLAMELARHHHGICPRNCCPTQETPVNEGAEKT